MMKLIVHWIYELKSNFEIVYFVWIAWKNYLHIVNCQKNCLHIVNCLKECEIFCLSYIIFNTLSWSDKNIITLQ